MHTHHTPNNEKKRANHLSPTNALKILQYTSKYTTHATHKNEKRKKQKQKKNSHHSKNGHITRELKQNRKKKTGRWTKSGGVVVVRGVRGGKKEYGESTYEDTGGTTRESSSALRGGDTLYCNFK